MSDSNNERPRARDVDLIVGILPTGPLNAITDVSDVRVGHTTVIEGDSVRTGVTAILPHGGNIYRERVPAAVYVGNGFGKLLGVTQVRELGELETPILLTCTLCVWRAADAMVDMPPVEFEVTAEKLDTGLRGFPVGTCWTSMVDPEEGVSYVGYPIADLAELAPASYAPRNAQQKGEFPHYDDWTDGQRGSLREIAQAMPASWGWVRPSVSWPMMMCPFSSRNSRWASTPKGRMPKPRPASISASHRASPYDAGACSSKPNSPTKPTRMSRAGMPATLPVRTPM